MLALILDAGSDRNGEFGVLAEGDLDADPALASAVGSPRPPKSLSLPR